MFCVGRVRIVIYLMMYDVIDQWKKRPPNAGDPRVPRAAIIYGLIYKWSLIDHANSEQGIVAWKEDVHCYNDGVIIWKDKWPNGLVKIKMATDNG